MIDHHGDSVSRAKAWQSYSTAGSDSDNSLRIVIIISGLTSGRPGWAAGNGL